MARLKISLAPMYLPSRYSVQANLFPNAEAAGSELQGKWHCLAGVQGPKGSTV